MAGGIGIDQDSNLVVFQDPAPKNFRFVCGGLELLTPQNVPRVNFVAALAVMEHLAEVEIREFAQRLKKFVEPKAIILITIPHPLVDKIVAAGITLRLLSGQDIDAHHGVKPLTVCSVIGSEGWQLVSWKRFQFGFNNELIFSQK